MTPIAQLTPVEPTITMPFNPPDPANPGRQLGINVEDVAAFMEFVRERAEIASEAGLAQAMTLLAQQVHPIALGNLHRAHRLAKQQAEKLLGLHMDASAQHGQINEIVDNVVSKLWAHEYKIGRREARELGLKAIEAEPELDGAIWNLFEGYESAMMLRKPRSTRPLRSNRARPRQRSRTWRWRTWKALSRRMPTDSTSNSIDRWRRRRQVSRSSSAPKSR
jgi:hypothetical protein